MTWVWVLVGVLVTLMLAGTAAYLGFFTWVMAKLLQPPG